MDSLNLFDLIIIMCGIYVLYSTIQMKRTGELTSGLMVGKNVDLKKAKDIPGFIKYMFVKSMVIGVLTILCGAAGIINTKLLGSVPYLELIVCGVYVVVMIGYCVLSVKAQKKYLMEK